MITTTGLDTLILDLTKAAVTAEVRTRKEMLEEGESLAETMRSYAPVLSGALRDSIEVEVVGSGVEIGPTVDYAHFPEYGTAHMAPEPYAGPSADKHAGPFATRILDAGADF